MKFAPTDSALFMIVIRMVIRNVRNALRLVEPEVQLFQL